MSSFFAGGMLILLLQLPIVLRPFFFKKPRIDSILMFLPLSLIIVVLYLIAFGIQFFSLLLAALVLLIFFTNFRALLRLKNRLFIDVYHFPFIVTSILETACLIWLGVMLILYRPAPDMKLTLSFTMEDGVSRRTELYTGDIYQGFQERNGIFSSIDAVLTVFCPEDGSTDDETVFLCAGGSCADISDYTPLLTELAERGYASLIMQDNSDDMSVSGGLWKGNVTRAFMMRFMLIRDNEEYSLYNREYMEKKLIETARLLEIAEKKYPGCRYIILSDDYPAGMMEKAFPDIQNVPLALKGCGLITLTKPLEAALINLERWGRKRRQENLSLPDRLVSYIFAQTGLTGGTAEEAE